MNAITATGGTSAGSDSLAVWAWWEVGIFDRHGKTATRWTLLDEASAEHRFRLVGMDRGFANVFMRRVEVMHGRSVGPLAPTNTTDYEMPRGSRHPQEVQS